MTLIQQDYNLVIKQIMQPQYAESAQEWLKEASFKDKQGLRIIGAIMKHKGKKKFKSRPKQEIDDGAIDFTNVNTEKAAEHFKKMIYGSTYERFFGKYHESKSGEAEILKYKKFTELKLTQHLNQMSSQYIENWTLLKDDDFYTSLVIVCLRNLYTFLKNLKPASTRHSEFFFWPQRHELVKPSRFDTIEKAVKKETHKNLFNAKYNELMKEYDSQLMPKVYQKKPGTSGITPAEIKQQLMRGSGNLLGSVQLNDPVASSYQSTFRGLMPRQITQPIRFDGAQSCSIGVVVPDPLTMTKIKNKQVEYQRDLRKVQSMTSTNQYFNDRRAASTAMNSGKRLKYW